MFRREFLVHWVDRVLRGHQGSQAHWGLLGRRVTEGMKVRLELQD